MSSRDNRPETNSKTGWKLLLVLPYIGLCFPSIYARETPTLFGFPFFYWYQFLWVILTSLLLGLVYLKLKDRED
ncbi:DUF3311 domain-containing protein [Edaphobacter flagellatus]|uniref:DUF3311 domain-containing protein n=1 Tax=Edaphobacter flagellatus TaxID=1933044 RepID=UPI0021B3D6E8|nr:DUF3311 domain-containing protein [Edaphobacter flagellatus]